MKERVFVLDSQGVKRTAQEMVCDGCKKIFLKIAKDVKKSIKHYCNQSCKINSNKPGGTLCTCDWCKTEFIRANNRIKNNKSGLLFCSVLCKNHALGTELPKEDCFGTKL